MAEDQVGFSKDIEMNLSPNPFLTEEIIEEVMLKYFPGPMPIESITISRNFKNDLLSKLRETEKAKYIIGVVPYPKAETLIPAEHWEGFKIIMDAEAYGEEFQAYLGLIHELCHVRDLDLYFRRFGYIHTKPLSMLRKLYYPEFLIWSEYIAVKNSFEHCVDLFGKIHPHESISLEIEVEVPEMHKLYHQMIAEEKKDPRFADAVKMETAVMVERFLKVYFAGNMAKIELNNRSFSDLVGGQKMVMEDVMELRHFIFDDELKELGKLLDESDNFDSAVFRLKNMAVCYNGIIEKLKKII